MILIPRTSFHDKVGPACIGGAGVEDFRDVRMIHQGQCLPLRFEAGDHASGVHAQLDDLQRDATTHGFVLFGHINNAAAAFAQFLEQLVRADIAPQLL